MNLRSCSLLLTLLCTAQNRPLFTLTEMEKLANCPDHACFRKAVSAKGYEFNKTETITTESGILNTHSYRILSTGQQPYRPGHIVTYAERGPLSRSVHFLTKSPAFPAQLDADINQLAYKTPQYGDIGRVEVFEDLGASKLWPPAHVKTTLCAVRPFDNGDTQRRRRGVIGDDGQLQEFLGSLFFDRSYARFSNETKPAAPVATPGRASQPKDFKAFIQRFSTDKAFQLSRVQFPLVWEAHTNDETIPHWDTKANWKHINILQPTDSIYKVFVNYPTSTKPTQASVSETCRGGDCGFSYGMSFRCVNGLW